MRVYVVEMQAVSVSAAITLIQIKAGAAPVKLLRAWISQSNQTSSAMQRAQILRKTAAATVTSFTPKRYDPGDAVSLAVGGTSATGYNASGEGTDGEVLYEQSFNVLNGLLWIPTPEERIVVPGAGFVALKFIDAPGSAMTVSAGAVFGEEGS